MAGGNKGNSDKEMAAHLRSRGIWHGKRTTSTHATHNYPKASDPEGTARYQRSRLPRQPRKTVGTRDPKGIK